VLSLALWVVEQPAEIPGRKKALMEADPGWEWTRGTIANLLELGFQDRPATIDFAMRELAWSILEPLTGDADPTSEHEAKYGGKNMDPATMAINTGRGKAFNALVAYALWVRRHLDRLPQVAATNNPPDFANCTPKLPTLPVRNTLSKPHTERSQNRWPIQARHYSDIKVG
jgi:hypothetical protein